MERNYSIITDICFSLPASLQIHNIPGIMESTYICVAILLQKEISKYVNNL